MSHTYIFDFSACEECKVWVFEDVSVVKIMRKKVNVCNVLQNSRIVYKDIKLEEQKTVSINWYNMKSVLEFFQEVHVKGYVLKHDKAQFHSARITVDVF